MNTNYFWYMIMFGILACASGLFAELDRKIFLQQMNEKRNEITTCNSYLADAETLIKSDKSTWRTGLWEEMINANDYGAGRVK